MLRASYLIFAGMVISSLGKGKTRDVWEFVGHSVIILGVVDFLFNSHH